MNTKSRFALSIRSSPELLLSQGLVFQRECPAHFAYSLPWLMMAWAVYLQVLYSG
jgi:hypothetical protein